MTTVESWRFLHMLTQGVKANKALQSNWLWRQVDLSKLHGSPLALAVVVAPFLQTVMPRQLSRLPVRSFPESDREKYPY